VNTDYTIFESVWSWRAAAQSVHAYPHIAFNSAALPQLVSSISNLTVRADWDMYAVDHDLQSSNVIANVAIDMFADADPSAASSAILANYEIMVWVGTYGQPHPIGFSDGPASWTATTGSIEL
jgi:xyloglucan-specific endo-beta-1,4-glucanase